MKLFSRKTAFCWVVGLAATLSACHDDITAAALTNKTGLPGKVTANAKVEPSGEGGLSLSSLSCALGCCAKKKAITQ